LAGAAGNGKTQACLTLSVLASLPVALQYINHLQLHGNGNDGDMKHVNPASVASGVIYIDTEGTFSAPRVGEIAQSMRPG
jgi:RecA/RadA recombinase